MPKWDQDTQRAHWASLWFMAWGQNEGNWGASGLGLGGAQRNQANLSEGRGR